MCSIGLDARAVEFGLPGRFTKLLEPRAQIAQLVLGRFELAAALVDVLFESAGRAFQLLAVGESRHQLVLGLGLFFGRSFAALARQTGLGVQRLHAAVQFGQRLGESAGLLLHRLLALQHPGALGTQVRHGVPESARFAFQSDETLAGLGHARFVLHVLAFGRLDDFGAGREFGGQLLALFSERGDLLGQHLAPFARAFVLVAGVARLQIQLHVAPFADGQLVPAAPVGRFERGPLGAKTLQVPLEAAHGLGRARGLDAGLFHLPAVGQQALVAGLAAAGGHHSRGVDHVTLGRQVIDPGIGPVQFQRGLQTVDDERVADTFGQHAVQRGEQVELIAQPAADSRVGKNFLRDTGPRAAVGAHADRGSAGGLRTTDQRGPSRAGLAKQPRGPLEVRVVLEDHGGQERPEVAFGDGFDFRPRVDEVRHHAMSPHAGRRAFGEQHAHAVGDTRESRRDVLQSM